MNTTRPTERLPFLDALRILAFALLVLYHVGMYYVSWGWHVKSPHAAAIGAAFEPWLMLASPWRMSLLFLISGAATGSLFARGEALRRRLARLLAPLLAGVLVVVPPQSFFEVRQQFGYTGSYADFLRLYFSAAGEFCKAGGGCLVLPTWNHLWFLPYLAAYTVLARLLLRAAPRVVALVAERAAALRAPGLIALPIVWLAATRWLLRDRFPPSHALVDDWYMHAQYLPIFLAGLAASRQPQLWQRLAQLRAWTLVLALLAWAGLMVVPTGTAGSAAAALRPWFGSTEQWCGVLAAAGFAVHHFREPRPWIRRLGEAVFPVYLVHQTVIIVAAMALAPLALRPLLEGPLLAVITFAASWAFYAAVRRVGWLRPWCGLAPLQAKRAAAASIEAARSA